MEKIYLVTGANGHLGSTIINLLLKEKKNIRAFVLENDVLHLDKKVEIIRGNITDKKSIYPLFKDLENKEVIVIHCAGIVTIASKFDQKVYDVNVVGTKNIADVALEYKVKKFIHVSSVHAIVEEKNKIIKEVDKFYPDKVEGLYAKTKAEASNYILDMSKKGLNAIVVHPSGIIGPGNYGKGHLSQLIIDYLNNRLTAIVKGGYDFVDVRDVADGILKAIEKGRVGECYILSNRYFEIKEIINLLHEVTNHKPIKTILPNWFAKLTAPIAELYYKILKQPPLYTSYSIYTLSTNSHFSHEKATKEIDYNPRDMKETLKDTVDWLKKIGRIK
mgnify:FL=1